MRKTLTTIAVIAVFFVFTSSNNAYDVAPKAGAFAPSFSFADNERKVTLSNLRGEFVVVNFWSSHDAESRIRNVVYDRFAKEHAKTVDFIAINYDKEEMLYREIVKIDNLDSKTQFYDYDGFDSEISERYHLEQGFRSYLINREGKIIAINPDKRQLTKLICQ
ncbi:MAG TPA: redoxin family protein [Candidatus Limisoma intestinavium]|uniref:Redoxin family protein n=1 Tax=Candidatus Limisoma intestinavium TaxID=2840856 RepID=A0A9D1IMT5_9BACT|nr:redoxin family protein [Candidatus Limisoma intestinavium]